MKWLVILVLLSGCPSIDCKEKVARLTGNLIDSTVIFCSDNRQTLVKLDSNTFACVCSKNSPLLEQK